MRVGIGSLLAGVLALGASQAGAAQTLVAGSSSEPSAKLKPMPLISVALPAVVAEPASHAVDAAAPITSIGPSAGAVPEPASWALMILGFGGIGAGLRRRRAVGARASSAEG